MIKAAGLSLLIWSLSAAALLACPMELPEAQIELGGREITVEIADNNAERSCGLMHRETMPANHGMLFIFDDERPLEFWMKNTILPLSIAYMSEDGTIVSIQQMKPRQTEETYPSDVPAKYALEMNPGLVLAPWHETGHANRHHAGTRAIVIQGAFHAEGDA